MDDIKTLKTMTDDELKQKAKSDVKLRRMVQEEMQRRKRAGVKSETESDKDKDV